MPVGKKKKKKKVHADSLGAGPAAAAPGEVGAAAVGEVGGLPGPAETKISVILQALYAAAVARAPTDASREILRDHGLTYVTRAVERESLEEVDAGPPPDEDLHQWSLSGLLCTEICTKFLDRELGLDSRSAISKRIKEWKRINRSKQQDQPLGLGDDDDGGKEEEDFVVAHGVKWVGFLLEYFDMRLNAVVSAYLDYCGRTPTLGEDDPMDIWTPVWTKYRAERADPSKMNEVMWMLAVELLVVMAEGRSMIQGTDKDPEKRDGTIEELQEERDGFDFAGPGELSDTYYKNVLEAMIRHQKAEKDLVEHRRFQAVMRDGLKIMRARQEKLFEQTRAEREVATAAEEFRVPDVNEGVMNAEMAQLVKYYDEKIEHDEHRISMARQNIEKWRREYEYAVRDETAAGKTPVRRARMIDSATGDEWVEPDSSHKTFLPSSPSDDGSTGGSRSPGQSPKGPIKILPYNGHAYLPDGPITDEVLDDVFGDLERMVPTTHFRGLKVWKDLVRPGAEGARGNQEDEVQSYITGVTNAVQDHADRRNCIVDTSYITLNVLLFSTDYRLRAVRLGAWVHWNMSKIDDAIFGDAAAADDDGPFFVDAGAAAAGAAAADPAQLFGLPDGGFIELEKIDKYDGEQFIPDGEITEEIAAQALRYLIKTPPMSTLARDLGVKTWMTLIASRRNLEQDTEAAMVADYITQVMTAVLDYGQDRGCRVNTAYVTFKVLPHGNYRLRAVRLVGWCAYNLKEIDAVVQWRDRALEMGGGRGTPPSMTELEGQLHRFEASSEPQKPPLLTLIMREYKGTPNEDFSAPGWYERNVRSLMMLLEGPDAKAYVEGAHDILVNEGLETTDQNDKLHNLYLRSRKWTSNRPAKEAERWEKLCRIIDPVTSASYDLVHSMAGRYGERVDGEFDGDTESEEENIFERVMAENEARSLAAAAAAAPPRVRDRDRRLLKPQAAAAAAAAAGDAPDEDDDGSDDDEDALFGVGSTGGRPAVDRMLDGVVEDSAAFSGNMMSMTPAEHLAEIKRLHDKLEKYHREVYRANELKDAEGKIARGEGFLIPFKSAQVDSYKPYTEPKKLSKEEREAQRKKVAAAFDAKKAAAGPGGIMGGRDTFVVDKNRLSPPWSVEAIGSLGVEEGPLFEVPASITDALAARGYLSKYLEEVKQVLEAPPAGKIVGWAGIEGLDLVKEKLAVSLIVPPGNPSLNTGVLTVNRNFLLWGPPGTGKTVVARRAAQLAHAVFVNVTGAWLMRGVQNEVAQRINALYGICRKLGRPVVVFIDEAEEVIQKRGKSQHADKAVTAFLTNLEQSEHPEPVFTIFATNFPANVDDAILSRIGVVVPLWLPSRDVRYKRFEKELQKGNDEGLVDDDVMDAVFLTECVDKSIWFSNRDITNCVRALYSSIQVKYLESIDMTTTDLGSLKVKKEDLPSLTRKDVLEGIAETPNSRKVAQEAFAWAVSTGTPVKKYVPVEYRKTLTQTKVGFAAFLV